MYLEAILLPALPPTDESLSVRAPDAACYDISQGHTCLCRLCTPPTHKQTCQHKGLQIQTATQTHRLALTHMHASQGHVMLVPASNALPVPKRTQYAKYHRLIDDPFIQQKDLIANLFSPIFVVDDS